MRFIEIEAELALPLGLQEIFVILRDVVAFDQPGIIGNGHGVQHHRRPIVVLGPQALMNGIPLGRAIARQQAALLQGCQWEDAALINIGEKSVVARFS